MKTLLATTALGLGLALGLASPAAALPYSIAFNVNVYHLMNPNASPQASDPTEQALPSAIAAATAGSQASQGTFIYTGMLDFNLLTGTNSLRAFIATGTGTVTGGITSVPNVVPLSSANFSDSTLLKFTFTIPTAASLTIQDDDGISLFTAGNTTTDLLPIAWASPTSAVMHTFNVTAGQYDLYYSEVNGLPAVLTATLNSVPEPATLALLGAGVLVAGFARSKRRA